LPTHFTNEVEQHSDIGLITRIGDVIALIAGPTCRARPNTYTYIVIARSLAYRSS